jgi:hypothetical protein
VISAAGCREVKANITRYADEGLSMKRTNDAAMIVRIQMCASAADNAADSAQTAPAAQLQPEDTFVRDNPTKS